MIGNEVANLTQDRELTLRWLLLLVFCFHNRALWHGTKQKPTLFSPKAPSDYGMAVINIADQTTEVGARVAQLHVIGGKRGVGGSRDGRAISVPVVAQGRAARSADAKCHGLTHDRRNALRLGGDEGSARRGGNRDVVQIPTFRRVGDAVDRVEAEAQV